jgi:hypothetical protein
MADGMVDCGDARISHLAIPSAITISHFTHAARV